MLSFRNENCNLVIVMLSFFFPHIQVDGKQITLEEEPDLQLPFLLPEDGYSCDTLRGVPNGLMDFLEPLRQIGLCSSAIPTTSSGLWTVYMSSQDQPLVSLAHIREHYNRKPKVHNFLHGNIELKTPVPLKHLHLKNGLT